MDETHDVQTTERTVIVKCEREEEKSDEAIQEWMVKKQSH